MYTNCPHCNQRLEAAEEMHGTAVECPTCSKTFTIPTSQTPTPVVAAVSNQPSAQQPTRPCPYCGETILTVAQKCKHCGEWLYGPRTSSKPTNKRPIKVVPVWTLPFFLLFTLDIYYFFWVYRAVRELHDREATDLTPGKAIGFLFIPLFNFIWQFLLWDRIARAVPNLYAKSGLPRPEIGFVLLLAPIAPVLFFLTLYEFPAPGPWIFLIFPCCHSFALCTVQGYMNRFEEVDRSRQALAAEQRESSAAAERERQQAELAEQQQRHLKRLQSRRTRRLIFGILLTCFGGVVVIAQIVMFFSNPLPGITVERHKSAAVVTGIVLGVAPLAGGIALLLATKSAKRSLLAEQKRVMANTTPPPIASG